MSSNFISKAFISEIVVVLNKKNYIKSINLKNNIINKNSLDQLIKLI